MANAVRITDELSVTAQPSAADIRRFAQLGYRTLVNNRPDGEEPGQLSLPRRKAKPRPFTSPTFIFL